jgi:hypothetical protein
LFFAAQGVADSFINSIVVMFVGDVPGTLIVIYAIRAYLHVEEARSKRSKDQY